ncbi:DUF4157 domain-containing protein [Thioalkalivibrio nitratireducens]|uniref:eCIS core domain-containing protein n=1 Tax=Thioalkalivibrio nitratireducens TaxID=186931 RepID=UPI001B80E26D|nr:DUF4157 domain-containing protein [Thioalkalivibrio nitratireducens]
MQRNASEGSPQENHELDEQQPVVAAARALSRLSSGLPAAAREQADDELAAAMRQPEEAEPVMREVAEPDEAMREPAGPEEAMREAFEESETLQRQEGEEIAQARAAREAGTEVDEVAGQPLDAETEAAIEARIGRGDPLREGVLHDMQTRFGRSFEQVRIHTDAEAAALCARIRARAFTVGSDVFFGPGEFDPGTERGRNLLAHELAHVVQQTGSARRQVQRDGDGSTAAGRFGEKKRGYIEFPHLAVPQELVSDYRRLAPFILHKSYSRARNDQTDVWRRSIRVDATVTKLQALVRGSPAHFLFEVPSARAYPRANEGRGRATEFLNTSSVADAARQAAIPRWDKEGNPHASRGNRGGNMGSYDVDHKVEQRFGARVPTGDFALRDDIHAMPNFFLLDGNINRNTKVNKLNIAIESALERFRRDNDEVYGGKQFSEWATRALMGRLSLKFMGATGGDAIGASGNNVWTQSEIERGDHIDALRPDAGDQARIFFRTAEDLERQVPANRRLILFGNTRKTVNPNGPASYRNMLAPFVLSRIENEDADDLLRFSIRLPPRGGLPAKDLEDPLVIKSLDGSERIGYAPMARFPLLMGLYRVARGESSSVLQHNAFSPISVDNWEVTEQGLVIQGEILPALPMLGNAGIHFEIAGNDIILYKTFSVTDISVPAPLSIDGCTLTVSGGTRGLRAEGQVDFAVDKLGTGYLRGLVGSDRKFGVEGSFDFNSEIFDPARITLGYRDDAFYGEGIIGIPASKVPGIRSATIAARFNEDGFAANGDAELDVPGVENGTMTVSYSDEEGLTVGGSFNLSSETPGIRSGTVRASLREREDGEGYALCATGEAVPDIPGFHSRLRVSYEDGAITAEAEAEYARGMLAGSIRAGATNRTLDADGNPTGEPGEEIVVYGGGSVTVQIAPWLQGTAGIAFAPDGEVTVTGEIALPSELPIFGRREFERSFFNISVQVPIITGVVAEIGGGLSASAVIGPGVIDRLRLGIEYNPAREQDTHVTGAAHLSIPASAGLRLSANAGIGLGITGASATGGLEIGGTLGVSGAAEAGVNIDWMPSRGLELNARVGVHAQPSFTFDISGYVRVRVLGKSLYYNRWELASLRYGSDMRFGIHLPVHYVEGEPFDISLNDIEFEVPNIDTRRLVRGLIARIK